MKKESPIGHWPSKCLGKNVGTEGIAMKGPQDMAMPNVLEEEPGGQARRTKGSWAEVRLEGEGRPHWPLGGTWLLRRMKWEPIAGMSRRMTSLTQDFRSSLCDFGNCCDKESVKAERDMAQFPEKEANSHSPGLCSSLEGLPWAKGGCHLQSTLPWQYFLISQT